MYAESPSCLFYFMLNKSYDTCFSIVHLVISIRNRVYRQPTGIYTPNRYTDTQQVYRHPTSIQTPNRYTDTQQVYRHPTGIQKPNRYKDTAQTYRHPTGKPTTTKYTDTQHIQNIFIKTNEHHRKLMRDESVHKSRKNKQDSGYIQAKQKRK